MIQSWQLGDIRLITWQFSKNVLFFFSLNCRYTYSFNKKRQECAPRPSKVAKKYAHIGDLLEQCLVTRLESHVNINIHQHPSKQEMVYKLRYSYPERIFRKDFLFNIMITSCKFEADFLVIINVAAISLQSERQLLETKGKNSCKRVKVRSRQCRMAFPRVRSQPNLLEFIAVPFSPLIIE